MTYERILRVDELKFSWAKCHYSFFTENGYVFMTLTNPSRLYDGVLDKFRGYCVTDASSYGSMIYNEEVEVTVKESEVGTHRVDVRLLHMKRPWVAVICDKVEIKEGFNETQNIQSNDP